METVIGYTAISVALLIGLGALGVGIRFISVGAVMPIAGPIRGR